MCLFIDEIHRLNPAVEEILYPAMEDFQLDLIIGEGPGGAFGEDRSVAVHPDRRHHPRRAVDQSVARPLRHSGAAQFLFRDGTRGDRQSRRARAWRRHLARRRQRDRAPRPRHAAHRGPPAAPRARLRACRWRQDRRPQDRRPRAASSSRSTPPASTRWTGAISRPSRTVTAAARWASIRSPPLCRSRATPSRTSSSRF